MITSTVVYVFFLVLGLGLAFVSGFLGEILGHFGGDGFDHPDVGGGVDVHADGVDFHADGVDVHAEGVELHPDVHADAVGHLSPVSPPILSTLMVLFGGVGLVAERMLGLPSLLAVPVSGVVAVGGAAAVFFALGKFLVAIQGTTHGALADVVGLEAQVITPIPAEGIGEVAYSHAGVRETRPARSEDGVVIPKHSMVSISRVAGATLIVRELVDERLRRLKREEPEGAAEEDTTPEV